MALAAARGLVRLGWSALARTRVGPGSDAGVRWGCVMRVIDPMRRSGACVRGFGGSGTTTLLAVLACVVLVAGCVAGTVRAADPSPAPSASPAASPAPSTPADPFVGHVVVTVTDDLVVRSLPRVADDSVIYRPYLPRGTELRVIGGPVKASGYTWYEVVPVSFVLDGHPASGWVAAAGKDGESWIALPGTTPGSGGVAKSTVPRATADPKAAKAAAASVNAFGIDLYKRLLADKTLDPKKGAVLSPTSIAFALGMALAGAKGDTATQMAKVLHTAGWDPFGQGLNSLDQALASRDATWKDRSGSDPGTRHSLDLELTNAAFAQQGWPIETLYLDRIGRALGVGLGLVDFIGHSTAARKTINAWVSDATKKRIRQLLGPGDVRPATRIALVNAMYLKGEWEMRTNGEPAFRPEETRAAPFVRLGGSSVRVPTMMTVGGQVVPYVRGTGWQATELRLVGAPNGWESTAPIAVTFVMPADLPSFERKLTPAQIGRIVTALDGQRRHLRDDVWYATHEPGDCGLFPYSVRLYLPRFDIDTRAALEDGLASLGMADLFDPAAADLTGITSQDQLFVGKVVHQAHIGVDEKGVEASAVTAVLGMTGGCLGPEPAKTITLRLDHPFLFFVRDVETGAILFMGRVVDPSKR
jgi:serpin B